MKNSKHREAFDRARSVLSTLIGCTESEAETAANRAWTLHRDRDLDAMSWLVSMNWFVAEAQCQAACRQARRAHLRPLKGGRS